MKGLKTEHRAVSLMLFCGVVIYSLLYAVWAFLPVFGQQAEPAYSTENTTEFAGGDGTERNPYRVSTPEQLDNVRNYLNAYFIQTQDIDMTAATAEGGAFYNEGAGWEPIGTKEQTSFSGNYDGGNYRIIGLKCDQSDSGTAYAGLFGYNSGVIQNLGIDDGAVSPIVSSENSDSYSYSGGIVGYNSGKIINCYSTSVVSATAKAIDESIDFNSSACSFAGGIVGWNDGSITNCYNIGTVSSASSAMTQISSSSPDSYAGGIAGYNNGNITNCYSAGAVYSDFCAGGITGDNSGSITNCYNSGSVASPASHAGGIAGKNDDSITNCYYYNAPNLNGEGGTALILEEMKQQTSYVGFDFETVWQFDSESYYPFPALQEMPLPEQEENTTEFAGGAGRLDNPYKVSTPEHLDNVRKYLGAYYIQTADIDLTEATAEGGAFYNNGGGWVPISAFTGSYDGRGHRVIGLKSNQTGSDATYVSLFGYNSGIIQNLGMDGGVVSVSFSSSGVNGSSYAGGIAGYNSGSIANCYNTGVVSASAVGLSYAYAGGIAGRNRGSITNCYNTGNISALHTYAPYAGGIVGDGGSITNCYNIGTLSVSNQVSYVPSNIGGITGYNGTVTNCYYYDVPDLKAKLGTALTLEEMKQQASYIGFDFETVWKFDSENYYPFPVLRKMAMPEQGEGNTIEFAGGTGRFDNPYQVATAEHLDNVRKYLDAYYIQTSDIDLTVATAEGGAFYNAGSSWAPIGTDEKTPFTGNYDGGGYRIIGLKSNQFGSDVEYAGLFGYNSGVIQNLGLDGGTVSSVSSYAGDIAGYNSGSVINCYNTGTVSAEDYAGGITGYNSGSITNCYNTGTVSAISYAGGITGANSGSITNCYNIGMVSSVSSYVGGISGYNYYNEDITNSYYYDVPDLKAEGGTALTLEEMKQQTSYVGFDFEIVWKIDSESYYPFPVLHGMTLPEQEEENTTDFAGGTGRFDNPYQVATAEHLDNVRKYLGAYYIQTADIDLTEVTSEGGAFYNDRSGWKPIGSDENTPFVGNYDGGGYRIIGLKSNQFGSDAEYAGLFGYNSGVIQNLGMDGGTVSSSYAGGVVGYNSGSITNCYNTGTVSAEDYAGGIAGHNSGSITDCYNTGTVSAEGYAGGITGYNSGSITDCYNTGAVSSSVSFMRLSSYAGGITGYNNGSITNCYNTGAVSSSALAIYAYAYDCFLLGTL